MTCRACERKLLCVYDFNCLDCCVRLVVDSKPSRERAKAMLAVIERFPGSPAREQILEQLRRIT